MPPRLARRIRSARRSDPADSGTAASDRPWSPVSPETSQPPPCRPPAPRPPPTPGRSRRSPTRGPWPAGTRRPPCRIAAVACGTAPGSTGGPCCRSRLPRPPGPRGTGTPCIVRSRSSLPSCRPGRGWQSPSRQPSRETSAMRPFPQTNSGASPCGRPRSRCPCPGWS